MSRNNGVVSTAAPSFWSKKKNVAMMSIFYTFLWGSAFPLVKLCVEGFAIADGDNMSKCLVAGIRFFFSGLLTLSLFRVVEKKPLKFEKPHIKYALVYGILGSALQYAFTYIGLTNISGSKGAVFDQLAVFLIVLAGGIFFKDDRLNAYKVIGCAVGFAGIMITNMAKLEFTFSFEGEGYMILAALCNASSYFIAKKSASGMSAMALVGGGHLIGGALLCVFSLVGGGRLTSVNPTAVITMVLLVGISSIAYILSLMPLKYHPASETSSFQLLITVFGAVMSALLLGESILRFNYLLALILVGLGILLVNKKPSAKNK